MNSSTKPKIPASVSRSHVLHVWHTHKSISAQKRRNQQDGPVIDVEDPHHGEKDEDVVARGELIKACRAYFAETYLKNKDNKVVDRCMYWGK
uniref:Uncharacterized protein n=1 Tax=Ciona savignyi TaxID=51511 RepID=H2ZGW0_CIOSA